MFDTFPSAGQPSHPFNKLVLVANTILGAEKAWGLFEINEQAPRGRGSHRYQIIQVIRNDHIAEWRRDMGPASKFRGINQIRIPSLMEHTVDELIDIANEIRGRPRIDIKDLLELERFKPV